VGGIRQSFYCFGAVRWRIVSTQVHKGLIVRGIRLGIASCALALGGCGGSSGDAPAPPQTPPAPIVGLDSRPTNLSCIAPAKTGTNAGTTIQLERVFPNLTFNQPLAMLQAPGDDSRWFVLQKSDQGAATTASVRVFANSPSVATTSTFLSLTVNSSSEGGLL